MKRLVIKIFHIEILWLSGCVVYKRKNVYYSSLIKTVLKIKDDKFNKIIMKRLKMGENRWTAEVIGKSFMEGLKIGLEGK